MLWLSSVQANHNNASCTFGDADHCFADTNLLILGSSTSRHWFFVLREVLNATATRNGAPVDLSRVGFVSLLSPRNRYAKNYRQHEKDLCGGGKLAWSGIDAVKTSLPLMPTGPRCSTFVKKTRTLLTFVWHLPFRREEARALGKAGQVVLADARANKLAKSRVLINGGLELAINVRNKTQPLAEAVNDTLPDVVAALRPVLDAGGSVTWRTATRVCCEKPWKRPAAQHQHQQDSNDSSISNVKGPVCLNRDGTDMAPVQSRLRAGNDEVVKQLAWREPRVTVLDSWALTDASKCPAYEDWVHAPSLAFEQLERWMQDELGCSCSGPPRTDPSPWWNNSRSKFAAAAAAAGRKGQTKKKNVSAARPLHLK